MPPPRVYKTPAIVLRQRRIGDVDKVITLYTAEHGKIEAVAKGVRRIKSRLAGYVEPLSHASFMLAHGRNLDIVTGAETIETFQPLHDDLGRLSHALYAAELLDRATEERSENFALYRLLLDTLRRLSQRDDLDLVLRQFEMSLLGQLGYRPQLDVCVTCGDPLDEASTVWAAALGGTLCPNCHPPDVGVRPLSTNALRLLRLLQSQSYQEVSRISVSAELASELERSLRDAVHHALERDVRSAKFLDTVRRGRGRQPVPGAGPW
jgi:DNA repair protein RecO (recombination protein O)